MTKQCTYGAVGLCLLGQACSSSDEGGAARTAILGDNAFPAYGGEGALGDSDGGDSAATAPTGSALPEDPGASPSEGIAADSAEPLTPAPQGGNGSIEPGTLTAGAWDDNRNINRFLDYRASLYESQMAGLLDVEEEEQRSGWAMRHSMLLRDAAQ